MFFENISSTWHHYTYEVADPRARDKIFMGSPLHLIVLCVLYVIVNSLVNKIMRNRQPFDTKTATLIFYTYLSIASGYFSYKFSVMWLFKYSWICEYPDFSSSEEALGIVDLCYHYFIFKITYMIETILTGLGKRKISTEDYYIIHHFSLPIYFWFGVNYTPGGEATFMCFVHSFVTTYVMSYFVFVFAFPQWKKNLLWWKMTIAPIQILQFIVIMIKGFPFFFYNPCGLPWLGIIIAWSYGLLIFLIFLLIIWRSKSKESKKQNLTIDVKSTVRLHFHSIYSDAEHEKDKMRV